jgi:hypothetical protein
MSFSISIRSAAAPRRAAAAHQSNPHIARIPAAVPVESSYHARRIKQATATGHYEIPKGVIYASKIVLNC